MRRSLLTIACSFALWVAFVSPLPADEPAKPLDWNEPITTFASFVADLSAQRLEEAWQAYRVMMPVPPRSPKTPFDPDPFEDFQKNIGRFPPEVTELQMIGTRNYSERSRRMFFIADTKVGPYLLETVVYRHQDEWFFGHFGYHSLVHVDQNWHRQYEDILPVTKLPEPVVVPLPVREPAAETAGK